MNIAHNLKMGGECERKLDKEYWGNYGKTYPINKARRVTRDSIKKFMNGDADDIQITKFRLEW